MPPTRDRPKAAPAPQRGSAQPPPEPCPRGPPEEALFKGPPAGEEGIANPNFQYFDRRPPRWPLEGWLTRVREASSIFFCLDVEERKFILRGVSSYCTAVNTISIFSCGSGPRLNMRILLSNDAANAREQRHVAEANVKV